MQVTIAQLVKPLRNFALVFQFLQGLATFPPGEYQPMTAVDSSTKDNSGAGPPPAVAGTAGTM
jgi:hypothetical protein